MGLKKPKKNTQKAIARNPAPNTSSKRATSIVVHNYYKAGPSGVQWTDRVLEIKQHDSPRPAKQPRLVSPSPPPHDHDQGKQLGPSLEQNVGGLIDVSRDSSQIPAPPSAQSPLYESPISHQPPTDMNDATSQKKKKVCSAVFVCSYSESDGHSPQKSANERLDEAKNHIPSILHRLLEKEAHPNIPGKCQNCLQRPALYRCRDCSEPPVLCRQCICQTHSNCPYHWVEEWIQPDPTVSKCCFKKRDLSELGFVFYLGHQGRRCEQVSSGPPDIYTLVVTHTNGIHNVLVEYCQCSSPRRLLPQDQLVLAGLIPASFQKLQSAFTVDVLEDAHEDILVSRKSPYDYMRKLRRRTNNSAAHHVTVCVATHVARLMIYISPGSLSGVFTCIQNVEIHEDDYAIGILPWHSIPRTRS